MLRLVPLLLLAAACRGVHAPDVAAQFERDFNEARLRIPVKADLHPARAASGEMAGTVAIAREYLDGDAGTSMHARYVRSLLAGAHLMRGENDAARAVMAGIKPNRDLHLVHENRVINAMIYAVSACRTLEARGALGDLFAKRVTPKDFAARFGSFVAIELPDPVAPAYAGMLDTAAGRLRAECFIEVSGDPYEMEIVHKRRAGMRRMVGEQYYNDMAALLDALPDGESAESEWLAWVGVSSYIAFGKVFAEVVPMSLSPQQKQWQLEQADGLIQTAMRTAARLTKRPIYARLPTHLRNTKIEIQGWIQTR